MALGRQDVGNGRAGGHGAAEGGQARSLFSWDFCWLAGGFSPTHLKKYAQVKLEEIIFPNFQGNLFETTT